MKNLISSAIFKRNYLKDVPSDFLWQKSPLQIYPLSFLSNHFKLPLPIIQTDYNYLFYIKNGNLVHRINNTVHRCISESIIFVSVGNISSLQKISKDLDGFFVLIEEKTMSALFNQQDLLNVFMIDPILKLKTDEGAWINSLCQLLFNELSSQNQNIQIGSSLTQALLNKIIDLSDSQRTISRNQQIAIQFKQLVYKHFRQHKSIQFYAELLTISSNYLNRCVKSVFNKNCKEIIIETTILNSQILLLDNTKSISEISFELNFEDPSYFTRIFKNLTNMTPKEYRNKVKHDLS